MAKKEPFLIDMRGIEYHRAKPILRGIDWQVRPGEHWAVLGPNGCGKTTLLQVLLGYESPSGGGFSLLGREYGESDWRQLRPWIGWVSTAAARRLEDFELVVDAVASGRKALLNTWHEHPERDLREARKWMERTGILHLENSVWAMLSQGERQRVLIARSLMARSRMLILDEPCAGLDPVARERFLLFLRRLLQQPDSPATVLVTHHVEEIVPEFTHVLVLRDGEVAAAGPRSKVMNSRVLSNSFQTPLKLRRSRERYILEIGGEARHDPALPIA